MPQGVYKVDWHTGLNVHMKSSEVFSFFLKKIYWCAKGGHKQHLFQQHDFPFNVYKSVANNYSKEQVVLRDQNREKS